MSDILARTPFLKIIIPAAAGIAMSRLISIPVWLAIMCCIVSVVMAVALYKRISGQVYVWFSILLFFFAMAGISSPRSRLPQGKRIAVAVQICERPDVRGRWQYTTADVGYYRYADSIGWTKVRERVMFAADTCYHDLEAGTQLAFYGWLNPVDTTGSSYGDLMKMRGLHGRMFLTAGNLISVSPYTSKTPAYYASNLQWAAIERLGRLDLDNTALQVVTAMTAGDKRGIDRDLRTSYSSAGAAHLLAVSGLHVGIVFILINLLLYLLPAARWGHIIKNVAAIAVIWLYASMAGLAPSVIRSALMFSFAQIAIATTSFRSALNIIVGSAVLMLAVNPNYATDPSFLLSYAAVISILLFFDPLFSLVRTRFKVINAILSVMIIGFVATLGTAPLISYWFGSIPVAGILINPVVILTAHIIVMAGVLWILLPFGFLKPLFSWVLSGAAWIQNCVVRWCASLGWGTLDVSLPLWAVLVLYAALVGIAILIYNRRSVGQKELSLP